MTQKERLEEAHKLLTSVYVEMREGKIDTCPDPRIAAVNCEVEAYRIMFRLNYPEEMSRLINERGDVNA